MQLPETSSPTSASPCRVKTTKVVSCTGEAFINKRKGKIIPVSPACGQASGVSAFTARLWRRRQGPEHFRSHGSVRTCASRRTQSYEIELKIGWEGEAREGGNESGAVIAAAQGTVRLPRRRPRRAPRLPGASGSRNAPSRGGMRRCTSRTSRTRTQTTTARSRRAERDTSLPLFSPSPPSPRPYERRRRAAPPLPAADHDGGRHHGGQQDEGGPAEARHARVPGEGARVRRLRWRRRRAAAVLAGWGEGFLGVASGNE